MRHRTLNPAFSHAEVGCKSKRACSSELEMTPILAVDQSEPVSGQSWRSHVTVEFNTLVADKSVEDSPM